MVEPFKPSLKERRRRVTEDAILDAAELLLEQNADPDFSMRALAAEAGVGFTTPFNYFGSKLAIMVALAHRVVSRISERYVQEDCQGQEAPERTLIMARCGVEEFLRQPNFSRAVIASLAVHDGSVTAVRARSQELWRIALGDGAGIAPEHVDYCNMVLPDQLALAFRGALTFWATGELRSEDMLAAIRSSVAVQLYGFVEPRHGERLLQLLRPEKSIIAVVSSN